MTKFKVSQNIVHQMHKLTLLNKTLWDTTPPHLYVYEDVSCFKYSTPHDNSYMGVMKKIK